MLQYQVRSIWHSPDPESRIVKTSTILEFFYEHIDEGDWLEGLDLYQSAKVHDIKDFHGLITASVSSNIRKDAEVRLKIHPSGRTIQWIECTCRKNRSTGRYCEHMAAFMINIDRERPALFGNLDTKMPMKPPVVGRKVKVPPLEPQGNEHPKDRVEGAAQTILNRLEGNIHSVSLMAKGPTMRVRLEIKPGQLTHYNLELDDAAKFLQSHPKLKTASEEVQSLKVYATPVMLGTRIYQADDERVVTERVVVIKGKNIEEPGRKRAKKAKDKEESTEPFVAADYKMFSRENPKGKEGTFEFFPVKSCSRNIGKEYFFVPERGFWPIPKEVWLPQWNELPLKKAYKEDAAAHLVATQFQEYLGVAPIWLESGLEDPIINEDPTIFEINVHKEVDGWFFLDPRYGAGKDSISMVELMRQFRKKRRDYLKAGNGWVKVPDLIKDQDWAVDESGKFLKVDAIGLMRLKAAVGDFDHFAGSKKLLNQIRNRLEFVSVGQAPKLVNTKLNLREYQLTGLEWLWWLYKNRLHGLLADEMGLGKTHQAMALMSAIQQEQKQCKFLVIAPTTVLDHWEDKVHDFCPNLRAVKHHGPKRGIKMHLLGKEFNTLITSYGVLLRDIKELTEVEWDAIILDEAHFVKNEDTATYRAACRLRGHIRICLTGTPMENHLGELKNIFDFLIPGYLGSKDYFRKTFVQPIESHERPEAELELQKLIHPFKLRRTKNNVLKDLPAKVEDIRHCELSAEQIKLYKDVLALKASPLIKQLQDEQNPIPFLHVFATLTILKQICNHPALVAKDPDYLKHDSGKFELLKEILEEALGSGHKVVIFSQYVEMIKIFEKHLTSAGIDHVTLTGQTRNRGAVIEKFQTQPDCKVFCGSLLAGGIGIDLTAASVVVHYDRWWNASKENQATDRVHRIGQNKNVQVLKLVTRGTLEEKIDEMIKAKHRLFEKFIDQDEEVFRQLTREQLIELLQ